MSGNTPEYRAQLIQAGRVLEAYAAFKEALAADPQNPNLLFNAGLGALANGLWAEAAAYWRQLKALVPHDFPIRARLVQVYERVPDVIQREAERAELHALYQQRKTAAETPAYYPRDQFEVGDWQVLALEYFELTGPMAVRYKFLIQRGADEASAYVLSLGSYDFTNDYARQQGHLQPGERLFHLDEYRANHHAGLGLFKNEPTYDAIKAAVCECIQAAPRHAR